MEIKFINGHKVIVSVRFNRVGLDIFVNRRVGQLSKLFYKNKEVLYPGIYNDYDVYYISLDSRKYISLDELLSDVMANIKVEKYANKYHKRFGYELSRALS